MRKQLEAQLNIAEEGQKKEEGEAGSKKAFIVKSKKPKKPKVEEKKPSEEEVKKEEEKVEETEETSQEGEKIKQEEEAVTQAKKEPEEEKKEVRYKEWDDDDWDAEDTVINQAALQPQR